MWLFTELLDTTGGFWILTGTFLSISSKLLYPTRISNRGKFMIISQAKLLVPSTFWFKLIFTELFDTTPGFWIQTFTLIPISSKLLILQEYVKKQSSGYFTSEAFGLYHFLDKVDIYGVIWYNYWFLNPDRYISLNIIETINPTRISNRGKFMIISQAKLSVPSTFWLNWIFTELFDTTRDYLNPDRYISLNVFETINPTRISNRR